jgi:hypothetical protein
MPSFSLTDLRNIRKLRSLLDAGEPIELRNRKTVIAQIIPESAWPAFVAERSRVASSGAVPAQKEGRERNSE